MTLKTEKRKFTIAELKRICSFPDDYVLTGTYDKQWERCGNSVPPLMMKAIAETLRDQVFSKLAELQWRDRIKSIPTPALALNLESKEQIIAIVPETPVKVPKQKLIQGKSSGKLDDKWVDYWKNRGLNRDE
jgi:hypothetical protein